MGQVADDTEQEQLELGGRALRSRLQCYLDETDETSLGRDRQILVLMSMRLDDFRLSKIERELADKAKNLISRILYNEDTAT